MASPLITFSLVPLEDVCHIYEHCSLRPATFVPILLSTTSTTMGLMSVTVVSTHCSSGYFDHYCGRSIDDLYGYYVKSPYGYVVEMVALVVL